MLSRVLEMYNDGLDLSRVFRELNETVRRSTSVEVSVSAAGVLGMITVRKVALLTRNDLENGYVRTSFSQQIHVTFIGLFSSSLSLLLQFTRIVSGDRLNDVKSSPLKHETLRQTRRRIRSQD